MPFFLGLGMILAVIAWDYPAFEYGRIPPDLYGFTPEERLGYAHATLDYLQRPEPSEEVIYLLEDLRLPNSDEPLYNDAEIIHMRDVKDLTDGIRTLWWITAVLVVIGLAFLLSQPALRAVGYRAIYQGGQPPLSFWRRLPFLSAWAGASFLCSSTNCSSRPVAGRFYTLIRSSAFFPNSSGSTLASL